MITLSGLNFAIVATVLCLGQATAEAKISTVSVRAYQDIWTTNVFSYAEPEGTLGGGLADVHLRVGGWGDVYYSLIKFNIATLPTVASRVTLKLYQTTDSMRPALVPFQIFRPTAGWDWTVQGTGTDNLRLWWADRPPAERYGLATYKPPQRGRFISINVTALYNSWQSGEFVNEGVELRPVFSGLGEQFDEFASSRDPNIKHRPQLIVQNNTGLLRSLTPQSNVPEPDEWFTMIVGLLSIGLVARRQRRRLALDDI